MHAITNYEELLHSLTDYHAQLVHYHDYLQNQLACAPPVILQSPSSEATHVAALETSTLGYQALEEQIQSLSVAHDENHQWENSMTVELAHCQTLL